MSQFKWDDRYDIGIESMNYEHQQLLKMMDQLEELMKIGKNFEAIKKAMVDLGAYATKHFHDEEKFMESFNYQGLESHKLIHACLLDKLAAFQTALEGGQLLGEQFFDFLNLWLESHICGIDSKYSEQWHRLRRAG